MTRPLKTIHRQRGSPPAATLRRSALLAGVLLALALLVAYWVAVPGEISGADAGNPRLVARGGQLYPTHCASCHGKNLEGEPDWRSPKPSGELPAPPHDANGHTWHHSDRQLFDITKQGGQPFMPPGMKSAMPAFEPVLADGDIWAVLAFIKSRWPAEIRARQARIPNAAR
jgi:mono/diheme cytochrome c family protein